MRSTLATFAKLTVIAIAAVSLTAACGGGSDSDSDKAKAVKDRAEKSVDDAENRVNNSGEGGKDYNFDQSPEPAINPDYNDCIARAATPAEAGKCVAVPK